MSDKVHNVVALMKESSLGSEDAAGDLDLGLYGELRRLAVAAMRRERHEHTLQPTALAHEAFMRLMKDQQVDIAERSQFLAASAVVMRRVLVDHARARRAHKRGGGQRPVRLAFDPAQREIDVLSLDESFEKLASVNKRAAAVVELKFFGGMNYSEIGQQLGVSSRTVQDDWQYAKAWLYRSMDQG